ncbi:retrovirus-related Pol polyprotein from type-1 retrotransposable element R2 [Trichonephila inaurata madagascariensis]|uniref:Retrovirus-related Pol polyprotein from type-1 retrotransposable element R2 n=1 Tax=Trichonephila inaurata madagascariensis TaxID=2747483 RepID=A0A8X7C9H3_9ARAC|nr:retrovirus-related Pol polyprotein from type-1 retrotransposable element R2 [Trichonephila inaurata madagascariensis]
MRSLTLPFHTERPPVLEQLSESFVAACLKSSENSAPVEGIIHDPDSKGDDSNSLQDWRPISLSDTSYKLFTKCLARKLSNWCETHEVISNAQKGFTPYDGVIEHNFLVDQHLAAARRDKVDKFAAWLDISNAFGSIPHAVIFEELRACGVDREFIGLVNNIYQNATTSVITNEGPTPSIPSGVESNKDARSVASCLTSPSTAYSSQFKTRGRASHPCFC